MKTPADTGSSFDFTPETADAGTESDGLPAPRSLELQAKRVSVSGVSW